MGRAADRRSRGTDRRAGAPASRRPGGAASRRAGHAQPRRRAAGNGRPLIGWSRRLGVAAALLVAGASVVFASQALGPGDGRRPSLGSPGPASATPATPSPLPALAAAPEVMPVAATLTSQPSVTLSGRLVEDLPREAYRLRVYVNGELERERRLPRRQQFSMQVALVEGLNSITFAVRGPAGEGLHSAPVEITLDSRAPDIVGLQPPTSTAIYAEQATLRGTTEPGATLRVTNQTTGFSTESVVGDDGSIELEVGLVMGANDILLETRDAAGNGGRAALTLERRHGAPAVDLTLSRSSLPLDGLPTLISLRADVRDAAGDPIDGAEVVFSLSPPGAPTLTFNATTIAGVARWPSVRISDAAGAGEGLATVLVTLPDGQTLTTSAFFTIDE